MKYVHLRPQINLHVTSKTQRRVIAKNDARPIVWQWLVRSSLRRVRIASGCILCREWRSCR
jgi:hypothetical protein